MGGPSLVRADPGLKNFIGTRGERRRPADRNIFPERKIADLQEVIRTEFIAGAVAGRKMPLTPFDMGDIVMGTTSCAVDTVGATPPMWTRRTSSTSGWLPKGDSTPWAMAAARRTRHRT